ncbi:MAG: dTDP-4-dehydrorhamnose reductase [Methylococcales bacterium]
MRSLLFGKNGQVGWELQRALSPLGELIAVDCDECDFTDPTAIRDLVRAIKPAVMVNAAAYTAVDEAEQEPDLAFAINAVAPEVLAGEAACCGAWLVHYSTDYVFDGSGDKPWRECEPTSPLSVYGRSKLAGDQAIQASGCRYMIFRTCWVYGARGGNFIRTILRLAQERDQLKIIDDQIGAPTGAELLADVTAHALRMAMLRPEIAGLYHLSASGEVSWYGYACFVLETARKLGLSVKVGTRGLEAIAASEYPSRAKRPLNSRLDTGKLQNTFDLYLPPWQAGVARMLHELYDEIPGIHHLCSK